jgi:outer membrane PBP1 activator LpoA protein
MYDTTSIHFLQELIKAKDDRAQEWKMQVKSNKMEDNKEKTSKLIKQLKNKLNKTVKMIAEL